MTNDEEEKILDDIDEKFKELQQYLKKRSISGKRYDDVVCPLIDTVELLQLKQKFVNVAKKVAKVIFVIFVVVVFFQVSWIYKIFSVLGRLLLLQILPWWDWTRIYYSDCILTNPFFTRRALGVDDCKACESVKSVEHLMNVSSKFVWDELLTNDAPFVVIDGMDDWLVMNTDNFWFDNITELYFSEKLKNQEPCDLTTNLRVPLNDLKTFLRTIHNQDIRSWFGHWENCDKKAAKALRYLYRRPKFLPSIVDISDSNWILMSSNYFSRYFHELDFSTDLLWVAQIRGWNRFQLTPREPCSFFCPPLSGSIKEGQIVVVTSFLWEFEYKPGEGTDNFAIAVGGSWN